MSETSDSFNAVQYAFFTPEGGQIVIRTNTFADLQAHLDALLEAVDETDGPGLLTTIQQVKAAGLIKEATSRATSSGGSTSAAASGSLPPWVLPEASKLMGREVTADEIKSGNYKNKPGKWYKVGDTWVNQPRG